MTARPGLELHAGEALRAARFEWRRAWGRRKLLRTLLPHLLPVAIALLVAALKLAGIVTVMGADILERILAAFYVQLLLVLVPLLFGTGLVARDAEARTLVFLLVRPLSRASLLVGKFAGAALAAWVLLLASMVAVAAILLGADGFRGAGDWPLHIAALSGTLLAGVLAYGALFTLVGLVFKRPALVGLFLAFGWEAALPFLPGWIKKLTVRHHLAALTPADSMPAGILEAMSPPGALAATAWLAAGSLLGLGLAAWIFTRRDYA